MRDQGVNSSRALTLDVSFIIRSLCRDFIGSIFADFHHSCVNTRLSKYPIVQASRHYCTVNVPGFRELRAVLPGSCLRISIQESLTTTTETTISNKSKRGAPVHKQTKCDPYRANRFAQNNRRNAISILKNDSTANETLLSVSIGMPPMLIRPHEHPTNHLLSTAPTLPTSPNASLASRHPSPSPHNTPLKYAVVIL